VISLVCRISLPSINAEVFRVTARSGDDSDHRKSVFGLSPDQRQIDGESISDDGRRAGDGPDGAALLMTVFGMTRMALPTPESVAW
jgi:hypothetical protein